MSFLTPLALALSALSIPIILLYMLRLRRTEMPISSTFLWQQLLRDREANAPWQRLRFSWLLLLQLLILLALVLALARPFSEVKTITTGRIVLLLDASASMRATDVEPNRFAAARAVGLELVENLGADDTMTVIRVSGVPEVLAAASRDKLVLRDAIDEARPADVSADWFGAMTLAAAGAVGVDELKVVIVTDGGLPPDLPPVPGDVRFVPVGESASNVALAALATSSLPGRAPELFARLTNYGDADTDVILSGYYNGSATLDWAYRYTVPAQGYVDIFEIELPPDFETLRAEVTLPGSASVPDHLAIDNAAYTVRDRSGAGRVLLVTDDNLFLNQIFRSLPGVELFEIAPGDGLPTDDFDLYVFDSWLPDDLPDADLLIVNPPRSTSIFTVGESARSGETLRVNADDPRMRNLTPFIEPVNMGDYTPLDSVEWATPLVLAGDAPLVLAGDVQDQQVALLAFDARYPNTDMVLQPAFPLVIAELVAWFSPPRITDVTESLSPGAPVTVRFIENADEAVIVTPDDDRVTLPAAASQAVFAETLQPGLYRVDLRRDGTTIKTEQFAVNLFDPVESNIAPRESVTIGTATVAQDAREETARREFWPWVAGLALLVLLVEWWVYHRSLQRGPVVTLAGLRGGVGARRGGSHPRWRRLERWFRGRGGRSARPRVPR